MLQGLKLVCEKLVEVLCIVLLGDVVVVQLCECIDLVIYYGSFCLGQVFSDVMCDGGCGLQMVVVLYGGFQMGVGDVEFGFIDVECFFYYVCFDRGFVMVIIEIIVGDFECYVKLINV